MSCLVDIFTYSYFYLFRQLVYLVLLAVSTTQDRATLRSLVPKSHARFTLEMTGVSLFLESELLLKYAGTRCLSS